ncbi:MAG: recombination protein RecR [Elusimicrobia bacterium RIFCSPLOWO2_01_FULL_59_12]|nr:MAG: recombination protein RecR [Elusimicrobia bacterium RIFCSPLOWO2_01_FULL_59_12]
MASSLELLRQRLALLPGVGPKMAERLAFYLLRAPVKEVDDLIRALGEARQHVILCPICFTCTEESPCRICGDPGRDPKVVCVVEHPPDVDAFERTKAFRGRYHVLHGALSPLDGVGPQELKVAELLKRIERDAVDEVIISTDPTLAGETTATYLAEKIKTLGAKVTRIGYGLPMGGDIEYTDELTLTRALEGRREI